MSDDAPECPAEDCEGRTSLARVLDPDDLALVVEVYECRECDCWRATTVRTPEQTGLTEWSS